MIIGLIVGLLVGGVLGALVCVALSLPRVSAVIAAVLGGVCGARLGAKAYVQPDLDSATSMPGQRGARSGSAAVSRRSTNGQGDRQPLLHKASSAAGTVADLNNDIVAVVWKRHAFVKDAWVGTVTEGEGSKFASLSTSTRRKFLFRRLVARKKYLFIITTTFPLDVIVPRCVGRVTVLTEDDLIDVGEVGSAEECV